MEGGAPDFGTQMVVRGGYFGSETPLRERFDQQYAWRVGYVGFRCVLTLPTAPDEARALLR